MWLVGTAAICVAAMIGVSLTWIRPINIELSRWTPESLPENWAEYRDRWAAWYAVRTIAVVLALVLLVLTLTAEEAH